MLGNAAAAGPEIGAEGLDPVGAGGLQLHDPATVALDLGPNHLTWQRPGDIKRAAGTIRDPIPIRTEAGDRDRFNHGGPP